MFLVFPPFTENHGAESFAPIGMDLKARLFSRERFGGRFFGRIEIFGWRPAGLDLEIFVERGLGSEAALIS
jgi:hypothetical protein